MGSGGARLEGSSAWIPSLLSQFQLLTIATSSSIALPPSPRTTPTHPLVPRRKTRTCLSPSLVPDSGRCVSGRVPEGWAGRVWGHAVRVKSLEACQREMAAGGEGAGAGDPLLRGTWLGCQTGRRHARVRRVRKASLAEVNVGLSESAGWFRGGRFSPGSRCGLSCSFPVPAGSGEDSPGLRQAQAERQWWDIRPGQRGEVRRPWDEVVWVACGALSNRLKVCGASCTEGAHRAAVHICIMGAVAKFTSPGPFSSPGPAVEGGTVLRMEPQGGWEGGRPVAGRLVVKLPG